MGKPRILTTSKDDDATFCWQSDGWYRMRDWGTPKADALFKRAKRAIEAGEDVPDVIARLEKAGFEVVREVK